MKKSGTGGAAFFCVYKEGRWWRVRAVGKSWLAKAWKYAAVD
jgi:hypothetical protein